MNRLFVILLMMVTVVSSGCVASRKFVRNEVKTSSDALSARIDANGAEIKETRDAVDQVNQRVSAVDQKVTGVDGRVTTVDGRVTTVDGKVASLDTKTTQGLNTLKGELKGDVSAVDSKATQATQSIASLDEKFKDRNNLNVAVEHAVPFKFDSAKLEADSKGQLDEIANTLMTDKNAIVVLEGHTDSTGDTEYNVRLSERRVDAVRRYLAEKNVPVYKIHQIGIGESRPVAENKSREGREKNRTVTITVLTSPDSKSAQLQTNATPVAP